MFGRMMNSFYYGKSGKGDFRKEDLPKNRWQLFFEMLRVRLAALFRLNLMTVVAFLPLIFVLGNAAMTFLSGLSGCMEYSDLLASGGDLSTISEEALALYANYVTDGVMNSAAFATDLFKAITLQSLIWLIPCILITGPVQAGMAYVTRNWARDEHAFIWADFKDAVKENWKQALGISAITSVVPIILYVCWTFYGQMAAENAFFYVPQILTISLGVIWMLGLTFMYPIIVSYKMKFRDVLKNSILLAIARLPQTIGIRLITAFLFILCVFLFIFTSASVYALLALGAYYIFLGFAMTRFIQASYTNAVFDKYINAHIEGAKVNRGLAQDEDDEDEEEETENGENPPSSEQQ